MFDFTGASRWVVLFTHDTKGRFETEKVQWSDIPTLDGLITRYFYDDAGRVARIQLGKQDVLVYSSEIHYVDDSQRPLVIKSQHLDTGQNATEEFFYDDANRLRKYEKFSNRDDVFERILMSDPGRETAESRKTYTFDAKGRLTSRSADWDLDGRVDYKAVYEYDCDI
ncbi:hypothetical protein WDW86_01460 [Bdellovibrionota bacterium FG-2]